MPKLSDERTLTDKEGNMYTLYVNKLEPVQAYMFVTMLGSFLVPALVALKQGKETELQPIVEQVFKSLTPDVRRQAMLDLFSTCIVARTDKESGRTSKHELMHGQPAINAAFAGDVSMLFRALGVALEVNFGSFFDVSGLAGKLIPTQSA